MATIRHLKNPPITEAVIEFSIEPNGSLTLDALKSVVEVIKDAYPKQASLETIEGGFHVEQGGVKVSPSLNTPLGFIVASVDQTQTVQFRLNGLAFSRLKPYQEWDKFIEQALGFWTQYSALLTTQKLRRIGLRYINEIEVPVTSKLQELFNVGPVLAPSNFEVAAFASNALVRDLPRGIEARLSLANQIETTGAERRYLIDIDVFKLGPEGIDQKRISDICQDLHNLKNELFFGLLSENVIKRYQ